MLNRLESLGLTSAEASLYLAVLGSPGIGAQRAGEIAGVPKSSVYPTLRALADKGLVRGGAGYGSRYEAVTPELALTSLIDEQREVIHERERVAKELVEDLADLIPGSELLEGELVEIVRDRRVLAERFESLQSSSTTEIQGFVKAPVVATSRGNPGLLDAVARGVRVRSIYENAFLDDGARDFHVPGEEVRVYDGDLPFKLALFDGHTALMPLHTPSERHPFTTLLLRHPSLGAGLQMLFETLWSQSGQADL